MNGAYYTTDDACKIANYDRLVEENKNLKEKLDKVMAERDTLKADNNILKNTIKEKDKRYLTIITEKNKRNKDLENELYKIKNEQKTLF